MSFVNLLTSKSCTTMLETEQLGYRNPFWKLFNWKCVVFSSQWLRGKKNPTCCASPTASLPSSSPTHTPVLRLRRSLSSSRLPAPRWRPGGGRTGTPQRNLIVDQRPSPWIKADMNICCYQLIAQFCHKRTSRRVGWETFLEIAY